MRNMLAGGRARLGSIGLVFALSVAVVIMSVIAVQSTTGLVVVFALLILPLLFWLPVWTLPSISLAVFAFVPVAYLTPVPQILGRFLTPAVIVLSIWLLRTLSQSARQRSRWIAVFASICFVLFLGILSLNSVSENRSFLWVAAFALCALFPALNLAVDRKTVDSLLRTWMFVGALLGVLALFETLAKFNPLSRYWSFDQHWSVYRVTTTLGHPLMNGTFFAMTACLALFVAIRGPRRGGAVITLVLSGAAAGLTGSRSAIYALVAGLAIGLVTLLFSPRVRLAAKIIGVSALAVAAVVIPTIPALADREDTSEALASSSYRDDVVALAISIFKQSPWTGGGPGTSGILASRAGAQLPLENAALGTLVSIGILGCAGMLVFLICVAWRALRNRRSESIAAMASFMVSGIAFPLWESVPASWLLLGLAALIGSVAVSESAAPDLAKDFVDTPSQVALPDRARLRV